MVIFLLLVVAFAGYVIGEARGQQKMRKALEGAHRIQLESRDRLIVELRDDKHFEEELEA